MDPILKDAPSRLPGETDTAYAARTGYPNAAPNKTALVKALQDKIAAWQAESAEIRSVAAQIARDLTANETSLIAENDASIARAQADIDALQKPPAATYDDRIKALQERRADLTEESRAITRTSRTRDLTDDERRTLQANVTSIAEIDHQVGLIERQQFENLPPAERAAALTEERDALAKADADAGTHLNVAAIARLNAEIDSVNAEIAAGNATTAKDAAALVGTGQTGTGAPAPGRSAPEIVAAESAPKGV